MTAPLKPGDFLRDHGIEISDSVAADFHMILAAFIAEGVAKMAAFGNGYPPDLTFEGWQEICAEIVAGSVTTSSSRATTRPGSSRSWTRASTCCGHGSRTSGTDADETTGATPLASSR